MKKITTLFERDWAGNKKVIGKITPGCEWVIAGEGYATRKWDGVAVLIDNDGRPWMRYDAKKGRTPPADFMPAQPEPDPTTGHWPGWVSAECPAGKWILKAIADHKGPIARGCTYEVCGPKIGTRHGANPEKLTEHKLIQHGVDLLPDCPRTYEGIMEYLRDKNIEGIVFYCPGREMVKIKKSNFPY